MCLFTVPPFTIKHTALDNYGPTLLKENKKLARHPCSKSPTVTWICQLAGRDLVLSGWISSSSRWTPEHPFCWCRSWQGRHGSWVGSFLMPYYLMQQGPLLLGGPCLHSDFLGVAPQSAACCGFLQLFPWFSKPLNCLTEPWTTWWPLSPLFLEVVELFALPTQWEQLLGILIT